MDEQIRTLEKKRQLVLNLSHAENILGVLFLVLQCVGLIICIISQYAALIYLLVTYTLMIIVFVYVDRSCKRNIKEFETQLRNEIVGPHIYERYGRPEYICQNRFTKEEIANFWVIPNTNLVRPFYYHSEDYLRGTYKGFAYEQCSSQMILFVRRRRGIKVPVPLKPKCDFNGFIFHFACPRFQNINSVKITATSFPFSKSGLLNQRVTTGNEVFDRYFIVSAVNAQDVYNMLTPQLMAAIVNIKNYFRDFSLYINRGSVYIAIDRLEDPINRVYDAPIDRYKLINMSDAYMNVTSRVLDTFFAALQ